MKIAVLLAMLTTANAAVTLINEAKQGITTEIVHLDSGWYSYSYTFAQQPLDGIHFELNDSTLLPPTLYSLEGALYASAFVNTPGWMSFITVKGQASITRIEFTTSLSPYQSIRVVEALGTNYTDVAGVWAPGRQVPEPSVALLLMSVILYRLRRR